MSVRSDVARRQAFLIGRLRDATRSLDGPHPSRARLDEATRNLLVVAREPNLNLVRGAARAFLDGASLNDIPMTAEILSLLPPLIFTAPPYWREVYGTSVWPYERVRGRLRLRADAVNTEFGGKMFSFFRHFDEWRSTQPRRGRRLLLPGEPNGGRRFVIRAGPLPAPRR